MPLKGDGCFWRAYMRFVCLIQKKGDNYYALLYNSMEMNFVVGYLANWNAIDETEFSAANVRVNIHAYIQCSPKVLNKASDLISGRYRLRFRNDRN